MIGSIHWVAEMARLAPAEKPTKAILLGSICHFWALLRMVAIAQATSMRGLGKAE